MLFLKKLPSKLVSTSKCTWLASRLTKCKKWQKTAATALSDLVPNLFSTRHPLLLACSRSETPRLQMTLRTNPEHLMPPAWPWACKHAHICRLRYFPSKTCLHFAPIKSPSGTRPSSCQKPNPATQPATLYIKNFYLLISIYFLPNCA